jgi:hypothetical protein
MILTRILLIGIFIIALSLSANAQSGFVATGGDAQGTGGSNSSSVGQIDYTSNKSTSGSASQGNQQAYSIKIVDGHSEKEINLSVKAYPNPTSDVLYLEIDPSYNQPLSYALLDNRGRLIQQVDISSTQSEILMSNLPISTYYLRIYSNQKTLKTFIIQKIR